jgi:hypothetical protein
LNLLPKSGYGNDDLPWLYTQPLQTKNTLQKNKKPFRKISQTKNLPDSDPDLTSSSLNDQAIETMISLGYILGHYKN